MRVQMEHQDSKEGGSRKTQDFRMLVEKLIEMKTLDPNSVNYNTTRAKDCQGRIINLFYQTRPMRENYELYRDFVYINKRLAKTRFKRNLILFCGVNHEGKTLIYGVAMLKEDDQESYQFAIKSFLGSVENKEP